MSKIFRIVISSILWVLESASIIGNFLVVVYICSMKREIISKSDMNRLSLAGTCFNYAAFNFISHILITFDGSYTSTVTFQVLYGIRRYCECVSYAAVTIMAIQRYYAIKYPLKYSRITKKMQFIYTALPWLWGFISVVNIRIEPYSLYQCGTVGTFIRVSMRLLVTYIPFISSIVFTILMCFAYYKMANMRSLMRISVLTKSKNTAPRMTDHRKFVKMTACIVFGYFLTCLPYVIVEDFINYMKIQSQLTMLLASSFRALLFVSSLVDALVDCFIYCNGHGISKIFEAS